LTIDAKKELQERSDVKAELNENTTEKKEWRVTDLMISW